jgi:hypothetical protein
MMRVSVKQILIKVQPTSTYGNFDFFSNDSRKLIPEDRKFVFVGGLNGIRIPLPYLINGGFEAGGASPLPDNWIRWSSNPSAVLALDYSVKHGGDRSARIDNPAKANSVWAQAFKGFVPGRSYNIVGWIKTNKVASDGGGASYFLLFYGDNGLLSTVAFDSQLHGTKRWTRLEKMITVPANTKTVIIEARVIGSSGTAWFDDITVLDQ